MPQILLVEDSTMFGRLAKNALERAFSVPVRWAKSYAEASLLLAEGGYGMALLDYNLPDAADGQIIDLVTDQGVSAFVFTSDDSVEVRERVWAKKVADYVVKKDRESLVAIIAAMVRVERNRETLVLVASASTEVRKTVSELLYIRHFRVLNAADVAGALAIVERYPKIRLVIADGRLPGFDYDDFSMKIRLLEQEEPPAILDLGKEGAGETSFLASSGADSPGKEGGLQVELFYGRVNRCLEKAGSSVRRESDG